MKRSHIIALVLIAVAMAAFIATLTDSSTFVDIAEAKARPGKEFKVKGYLDKTAPVEYEPLVNANLTTFTLVDDQGEKCRVRLAKAKPYDFERSESIVLTGKVNGSGEFEAHDMLMKCPSKYNEMQQMSEAGS
ncbi:MAG: cytochrome c maturation protein CcmE [Flavobacteriales bacterium]|jgi:cytochrome c-type biogenesis protein CcmE|nr:MAG: cytochrome c maturation protein CcmE [Flavobacteriales bacterium]